MQYCTNTPDCCACSSWNTVLSSVTNSVTVSCSVGNRVATISRCVQSRMACQQVVQYPTRRVFFHYVGDGIALDAVIIQGGEDDLVAVSILCGGLQDMGEADRQP